MSITDIIREPGKFEGEPVYVRQLWNDVLQGADDGTIYDGDTPVSVFYLDTDSRKVFGLDETDHVLLLWESEQGFVYSRVMTESDFTNFQHECEQE